MWPSWAASLHGSVVPASLHGSVVQAPLHGSVVHVHNVAFASPSVRSTHSSAGAGASVNEVSHSLVTTSRMQREIK